jgi:hypothetical protein
MYRSKTFFRNGRFLRYGLSRCTNYLRLLKMPSFDKIPVEEEFNQLIEKIELNDQGALRLRLIELINQLIDTKFDALLQLLYRLDIDENKLRKMLSNHKDTDAATLIADMIIDRQIQKSISRKKYSKPPGNDEEEKWTA